MNKSTETEIKLTQGKVTTVDADDFERLSIYKWHYNGGYAKRWTTVQGKRVAIRMHREVMNLSDSKFEVDHINGNPLDNRKGNLRVCTHQENTMNRNINKNNKSGFAGVHLYKRHKYKKWAAQITVNGKRTCLGYYHTPIEAAKAYNKAIKQLKNNFIRPNVLKADV